MTIIDVAKAAGVSKSTVSRVINAHAAVSPAVVRRVRRAMQELDYIPSANRRGPKPKRREAAGLRVGSIGLLLYGRGKELLDFPSTGRFLAGYTSAAQGRRLIPAVIEMPDPGLISTVVRKGDLDGLVIMGYEWAPDEAGADLFAGLPAVWCGGAEQAKPLVEQIVLDNREAGRMAADYLITRKCRCPVYLNHDPAHGAFRARLPAFKQRLQEAGLPFRAFVCGHRRVREQDMWSADRLHADLGRLADRLLRTTPEFDGLYTPSDQQAAVLCSVLRDRGLRPHRDFTLISMNNDTPWLFTIRPRPATLDVRSYAMGQLAVERLLARIQDPKEEPQTLRVQPMLIPGEE